VLISIYSQKLEPDYYSILLSGVIRNFTVYWVAGRTDSFFWYHSKAAVSFRMEAKEMKGRIWIVAVLLILISVSAQAQKVSVGFDRAVDFSKFKTYTWTKGTPAKNPQIDAQIISLIDQQLQAKGWQRVSENGDANISYDAAVVTSFDQATVARPGTWGAQTGSMDQAWQVLRGSLVVQIKNRSTNEEIWRAAATDTLSNDVKKDVSKEVSEGTKKIKKVVDKMFKVFPPPKTGT
jgi:hypothetical protein